MPSTRSNSTRRAAARLTNHQIEPQSQIQSQHSNCSGSTASLPPNYSIYLPIPSNVSVPNNHTKAFTFRQAPLDMVDLRDGSESQLSHVDRERAYLEGQELLSDVWRSKREFKDELNVLEKKRGRGGRIKFQRKLRSRRVVSVSVVGGVAGTVEPISRSQSQSESPDRNPPTSLWHSVGLNYPCLCQLTPAKRAFRLSHDPPSKTSLEVAIPRASATNQEISSRRLTVGSELPDWGYVSSGSSDSSPAGKSKDEVDDSTITSFNCLWEDFVSPQRIIEGAPSFSKRDKGKGKAKEYQHPRWVFPRSTLNQNQDLGVIGENFPPPAGVAALTTSRLRTQEGVVPNDNAIRVISGIVETGRRVEDDDLVAENISDLGVTRTDGRSNGLETYWKRRREWWRHTMLDDGRYGSVWDEISPPYRFQSRPFNRKPSHSSTTTAPTTTTTSSTSTLPRTTAHKDRSRIPNDENQQDYKLFRNYALLDHPFHPDPLHYFRENPQALVYWIVPLHGPVIVPGLSDHIEWDLSIGHLGADKLGISSDNETKRSQRPKSWLSTGQYLAAIPHGVNRHESESADQVGEPPPRPDENHHHHHRHLSKNSQPSFSLFPFQSSSTSSLLKASRSTGPAPLPLIWTRDLLDSFLETLRSWQDIPGLGDFSFVISGPKPDPYLALTPPPTLGTSHSCLPTYEESDLPFTAVIDPLRTRNRDHASTTTGLDSPIEAEVDRTVWCHLNRPCPLVRKQRIPVRVEVGDHVRIYCRAGKALRWRTWLHSLVVTVGGNQAPNVILSGAKTKQPQDVIGVKNPTRTSSIRKPSDDTSNPQPAFVGEGRLRSEVQQFKKGSEGDKTENMSSPTLLPRSLSFRGSRLALIGPRGEIITIA